MQICNFFLEAKATYTRVHSFNLTETNKRLLSQTSKQAF